MVLIAVVLLRNDTIHLLTEQTLTDCIPADAPATSNRRHNCPKAIHPSRAQAVPIIRLDSETAKILLPQYTKGICSTYRTLAARVACLHYRRPCRAHNRNNRDLLANLPLRVSLDACLRASGAVLAPWLARAQ